jgi:dihydroorotate dehydrogenase (NAD+) catalytic subunit
VAGIELGLPTDGGGEAALDLVEAAVGELPLAVCLPLNLAGDDWVKRLPELGASAITLGAPRGALLNENGKPVRGRMYGPSLLPWMFPALFQLRRLGIPLIAGAGIQRRADAEALLKAGAVAVQLDAPVWRGWF